MHVCVCWPSPPSNSVRLSSLCLPHLLLQYAVKDEDEHALERVEDGEEVGHDDGALVDVHQAESPGKAQQTQQGYGSDHPRPDKRGKAMTSYYTSLSFGFSLSLYCMHTYNIKYIKYALF